MAGSFEEDFAAALANLASSTNFNINPANTVRPMSFSDPGYKQVGPVGGVQTDLPAYYGPPASGPAGGGGGFWEGAKGIGFDLLHALGGISNFVTDYVAKETDPNASFKDRMLLQLSGPGGNFLSNIAKGQWEAWHDNKWSLADVPILGGLINQGKNGKTSHDIFENAGFHEAPADPNAGWNLLQHRKGNFDLGDLGEFGVDVLADPLTYLTFGLGGAAKAGAKGAAEAAARELGAQGLETSLKGAARSGLFGGFKPTVEGIAELASKRTLNNTVEQGLKHGLMGPFPEAFTDAARMQNAVLNGAKTAREAAQNSLFHVGVPFTDLQASFGSKPGFLKIADNLIGDVGKAPITRKLAEMGLDEAAQKALLKSAYGVEDAARMTSQASKHFWENVGKVHPGQTLTDILKPVTEEALHYHPFNPEDVLKGLTNPIDQGYARHGYNAIGTATETPAILGGGKTLLNDLSRIKTQLPEALQFRAEQLFQYANDVPGMVNQDDILRSIDELMKAGEGFKNAGHTAETFFPQFEKAQALVPDAAKTLDNANQIFGDVSKFAQDMGGTSKLGRAVGDKLSFINPRSLGAADPFVDEAAGKIRDAENFIRSNADWTKRELEGLQKMAKGLTPDDLRKIPYILEGKAPGGQSLDQFLQDVTDKGQLQQVTDYLKGMFERQAGREMGAGSLTKTIDGYFPHVLDRAKPGPLSPDTLEAMLADPEMAKYMGRSAKNAFDKTRKGFSSFAEWDDTLKSLQEARLKVTDPAELEKIDSAIAELSQLFERNPISATAARFDKGIRAQAMKGLYDDLNKMGAIHYPADLKTTGVTRGMDGFVRLDADTAKKLGMAPGTAIHKDVLQGLERVPHLFTDKGMNHFVENMVSVSNIWKNLVTTYIPAHQVNNFLGNMANTTMAGVGLDSYREAGQILGKAKKGLLSEAERKMMQEAVDHGVLGGGSLMEFIDPSAVGRGAGFLQELEARVANTRWAKGSRAIGNNVEDLSRLATYLHGRKTLGSAKAGADMVRKYLFNYSELTNADRAIKIGVPFWNWTKNNLPLQIGEFLRNPKFAINVKRLQDALNNDNQNDVYLPDYVQEGSFRVPGTESFVNPRIPTQDAFAFLNDPLGNTVNMASPAVKVPFELTTNKQVFNGAPIDPTRTDRLGYDSGALSKYLVNQTGIGGKMFNIFDQLFLNQTDSKGRPQPPEQNQQDIFDSIMSLFASRPFHYDQQKATKSHRAQIMQDRKALQARSRN